MSTRTYRPGFHKTQFFGLVPSARLVERPSRRTGIINTVLAGRVYAIHGAGGRELEQVCAESLSEAIRIGREQWGDGCRAVVLHSGDFECKGRTLKVREGRIPT